MEITIDASWSILVGLLMIRIGAITLSTPLDGMGQIPVMVKSLLVFICAAMLVTNLDLVNKVTMPSNVMQLGVMALQEIALSLCLAVGMHAATSVFIMAGRVIDNQAGFSAAAVFNPATNMDDSLIGTVLTCVAVICFFALNFHLIMLKGIIYSIESMPPGKISFNGDLSPLIKQIGIMFGFGLTIAAPTIFVLFLMDCVIGIAAKTMPQMNIYFVSLPIKIFFALLILGVSVLLLQNIIYKVFMNVFGYWDVFLKNSAT